MAGDGRAQMIGVAGSSPATTMSREPSLTPEHRMGRNYLWHRHGDASNAILAAVGYNFRRLIQWLKLLLFQILTRLIARLQLAPS